MYFMSHDKSLRQLYQNSLQIESKIFKIETDFREKDFGKDITLDIKILNKNFNNNSTFYTDSMGLDL